MVKNKHTFVLRQSLEPYLCLVLHAEVHVHEHGTISCTLCTFVNATAPSSPGAQSVVLTDRNIASTEANIQANRENLRGRQVTVSQLEWGQDVSSFDPPFDVLLAADVVYIEESFPLLLQSLCDLSSHETAIFLSSKHRYEREDRFIQMAQSVFRTEVLWSDQALRIYRLYKRLHKQ